MGSMARSVGPMRRLLPPLVLFLFQSMLPVSAFFAPGGLPPPAPTSQTHRAPTSTSLAAAKIYNADYAWREKWWPIAFEKVTDRSRPHAFELLGTPVVFWYNHQAKQWQATEDTCPHRLAPLSEGRVDETGCIECPYHGMFFLGGHRDCSID